MQNRVNQMVEECHRQESNLHLVNSRRQIVAAQIRRGLCCPLHFLLCIVHAPSDFFSFSDVMCPLEGWIIV
mgnify:CR=1 FL=1